MFWFWVRRQFRRYFMPIVPEKQAQKWYNISTAAYFVCCWSILGYVVFKVTSKPEQSGSSMQTAEDRARYYGTLLGMEKMEVIKFKGLSYAGTSTFSLEEQRKKQQMELDIKNAEFYGEPLDTSANTDLINGRS